MSTLLVTFVVCQPSLSRHHRVVMYSASSILHNMIFPSHSRKHAKFRPTAQHYFFFFFFFMIAVMEN